MKDQSELPWWEQEWFLEWKELAKREYHGRPDIPLFSYDDVVSKVVE